MAEVTRKSRIAIKKETTEGTPVLPATGTDFIAVQDGFTFAPETDVLENAELRSSIGTAKPILGLERANVELSHYLRHSGVEGQAPSYGAILESALGSVDVESTQYLTASGSTTSVINVTTGSGANFRRGQGLLIKDATNNYSARPVLSVATDALTLGFQVGTAPASGLGLGKNVGYLVADDSHPTITTTLYRGNGGNIEVVSGNRVTDLSIEVTAGELINMSATMVGRNYYFDPIEITATTKYIDFTTDTGSGLTAILSEKLYRDPHDLASEVQTKMDAAAGASEVITCVYNDTGANKGKSTITAASTAVFELDFATGANTANSAATKLGFTVADETGALTYTSDSVQSWAALVSPSYDAADPRAAKSCEVLIGDADDTLNVCVQEMTINLTNDRQELECISAETGVDSSLIAGREVTVELTATLDRHDADKFKRYRLGSATAFLFNFGDKLASNWIAGTVGQVYLPTTTVTAFEVTDVDGIVGLNLTLQAYVDNSGNGELYVNFL